MGSEFTLGPDQPATVTDSGLTICLVEVTVDERCPIDVECYATGPVTFTISVQAGSDSPIEFVMRTFTDYNGHSPEGPFKGIQDRIEVGDYVIRVAAVLPHPQGFGDKVKSSEYRVMFVVIHK